jgi:hypothetical protein
VFCFICGCDHLLHFIADLTLASLDSTDLPVTFELREEAVGIGQFDLIAKYGIGEAVGRAGEILEDEYGIAVIPERFTDIVTGVDPSKFAQGSGRIGEEVMRRGFGFGADGKQVAASSTSGGRPVPGTNSGAVRSMALRLYL